eukprot:212632-Rhodomonas_salina.2
MQLFSADASSGRARRGSHPSYFATLPIDLLPRWLACVQQLWLSAFATSCPGHSTIPFLGALS